MFDIITDSACDLTPETARQLGIEVIPFYVSLDGEHYRKEGTEIAVRDFYQFMVDNPSAYPKTSLASIEDFEQTFRAHAEAGRDVLCLVFTGKMSGCVGSARNARELVLEDYPDARIEVIDSAAATVTESTMVENAVAMRDAGCSLDETVTWLEAEKVTNQIFFTVGYGYDAAECKRLWMQTRAALRAKYPGAQCEVGLLQIGCTIAVHTGPYALGMGVMRRWKKQN